MGTPRVLIADDDPALRFTLRAILEEEGIEVIEAADGAEALTILGERPVDLVFSDLKMPRLDGMGLLEAARGLPGAPRIVLVTAHGDERRAVEAMKAGALDYLPKPFDPDEVAEVARRALNTQAPSGAGDAEAVAALREHMVFASPRMERLALWVHRVAPRDVTVLITGESGTGKERVAQAIVAASPRKRRPFIRFNCAALSPELAEAELFGHARGAFTGAAGERPGLVREAHGGTLFLDEVGELDLRTQGSLLRVLQEGEVRPVGEALPRRVDVRFVAATNRPLHEAVEAGTFRKDLFYRLNVVNLHVPPLRDRPEDIEPLAHHFARQLGARFGVGEVTLSPWILSRLNQWRWEGNVRELEHVIARMVVLSSGPVLDHDPFAQEPGEDGAGDASLKDRVSRFERDLIADMLARCDGNQSEAARRLDVSRVTLIDKMKRYGLR